MTTTILSEKDSKAIKEMSDQVDDMTVQLTENIKSMKSSIKQIMKMLKNEN